MNIRIGKLVATACMIVAGLAAGVSEGRAQGGLFTPIGTINACGVTSTVVLSSAAFGNITFTATGTAKFKTIGNQTGPDATQQVPVSLLATGNAGQLGEATWEFDVSGTNTVSTINSLQRGATFPAAANLYFTVKAKFRNQPGKVYTSVGEVHIKNGNLNSFNPQNNETYLLANTVSFSEAATPATVAFTIPAMTVIVSAAQAQNPNDPLN